MIRPRGIGPGLVFALAVIGPGSFISHATAGANYGFSLLWVLVLAVTLRFVWLDTSARYVLITGESLMTGFARMGPWTEWTVLGALIVLRHLHNLYKVLLLGFTVHILLPLPTSQSIRIWSAFFMAAGFVMMFWGGYGAVERLCKVLVVALGGALAWVALATGPDPVTLVGSLLTPTLPESAGRYGALLVVTAIIGTEAGSLSNLTYAYFMHEKGWRTRADLRIQRIDLLVSAVTVLLVGSMIQVAAAGSLHADGQLIDTAEDLVRVFTGVLGEPGRVIFALGLWAAVFTGYVGPTTGYAMVATDILRRRVGPAPTPVDPEAPGITQRDPIFRALVALWCITPLYGLFTDWEPVTLALITSGVVIVIVPVIGIALIRITTDKSLMGEERNGPLRTGMLVLTVLVSLVLLVQNAMAFLGGPGI